MIEDEADLVIILDSSSNDLKSAKLLTENGMDVLVLDHHHVEKNNPYITLVNPQQKGCQYPNKQSSAGLLTYKVIELMDEYFKTDHAKEFKSLAGFALVADAMNMLEPENRYYFDQSLKNLNHQGIEKLFKLFNKDLKNLSGEDFSYQVSPCITSATRLDQIELAIDLLMTTRNNPSLTSLCKELIELNEERKQLQYDILQRIVPSIDNSKNFILVIDEISSGIRGLIAQDLTKLFNKPSFVVSQYEDKIAGSFRSPENIPLLSILETCEMLTQCGGHPHAGGIDVSVDNLESFVLDLNDKLKDYKTENLLFYDFEIRKKDIDQKLIEEINKFYRLTGNGFEKGKFLIKDIEIQNIDILGKNKDTIKITTDNFVLMKFKTDKKTIDLFKTNMVINVLGTLNVNKWYNPSKKRTVITNQVLIEDFEITDKKIEGFGF